MNRFIKKALLPWVLVVIMIPISLAIIGCQEPPVNMVGVGETVITPPDPVGVSLSGFDRGENTSTGVHDDLYARSVIVEGEDGRAVALMTIAIWCKALRRAGRASCHLSFACKCKPAVPAGPTKEYRLNI